jgi:hypothetical protein
MRLSPRRAAPVVVFAVALVVATGSNARTQAHLDIRGNWSMPTVTSTGAVYPQVWVIATENLTTGVWHGHIKGNATAQVSGTVSGHTFVSHAKIGSYTSRGQATIVTGVKWKLVRGTFADSQGTTGTFTGLRLSRTPSG